MEKHEQEQEQLLWKSESPESIVSLTIARAISTLLATRTSKLHQFISRLSDRKPPPGSLEDSLWFIHKYVKDATQRNEKLDEILIPLIENCLRTADSKHGTQAMIVINWLFQDEFIFEAVAMNLADIIVRNEDRYVALGWCILVRGLLEYENFMDKYTLKGIIDNYNALIKILCSCVPHLSPIVSSGSTLQDGYELPSRLSVSAADCILSISEALTRKCKIGYKPSTLKPKVSDQRITLLPAATGGKKENHTFKPSEISNLDLAFLLWNQMGELITLLQRLCAWSRKSRPLHSKGVEQVLKWLQRVKGQYGHVQDEADENILKTGALLLSSCWKHYSILLHLEDPKSYKNCNALLEEYISGIQYYTDSNAKENTEDSGAETRKFFLNCLCLLLGRLDGQKFENIMSEYGMQISRVLLSQLHSADEDVVAGAVYIFKAAIFRPNSTSGSTLSDSRQIDSVFPMLLQLLDERDGTARAVVILIAEYCSMSTGIHFLKQVLARLASTNALQRRNAIDIISELVSISSNSVNNLSHSAWQDIANNLLDCLSDEEIAIREQASHLLPMMDPALVLPALVPLVYSSEGVQTSATAAFVGILKHHNQRPEVICLLLDCLSKASRCLAPSKASAELLEGAKEHVDQVLKLIPEWSKSVKEWNPLIGPLLDKMFAEPANAIIVRFLSLISEHLADAANKVLHHVMLQMEEQKEIDEDSLSRLGRISITNEDLVEVQESLFKRLCPLLIIRLLPLRIFDDLNSSIMYGQLSNKAISEYRDVNWAGCKCVVAFLLKRAFGRSEFEDVQKLAAELCGRILPQVFLPIASSLLVDAAEHHDILKVKTCIYSVCTSLVVRGRDCISHQVILEIRRMLETILLWPSLDGDEVSKAQHGCIDCLALMICAEMQALQSWNVVPDDSVHVYVTNKLINDKDESVSSSTLGSNNCVFEAPVPHSYRLCMANVLISVCQKIPETQKKHFSQRTLPLLIQSVEVVMHPEIRAACIQVLFSAVYHLKSAVIPYSLDLLKLSLKGLREGSEKERMAGAKLMASLMASEDTILQSISGGLVEARSVLTRISLSDSSPDLQQICKTLLACITSPQLA